MQSPSLESSPWVSLFRRLCQEKRGPRLAREALIYSPPRLLSPSAAWSRLSLFGCCDSFLANLEFTCRQGWNLRCPTWLYPLSWWDEASPEATPHCSRASNLRHLPPTCCRIHPDITLVPDQGSREPWSLSSRCWPPYQSITGHASVSHSLTHSALNQLT